MDVHETLRELKAAMTNLSTKDDIRQLREDVEKIATSLGARNEKLEYRVFELENEKDRLRAEVSKLQAEKTELQGQLAQLVKEAANVQRDLNDQEQHGRQWNLHSTNVDVNNVTPGGGIKFQNWGQGGKGGGSCSQEQEKLGNRNTLGAVGGSSTPSSRNARRKNRRSRDGPPEAASKKAVGLDASKMSSDELQRRIKTITEEYCANQSLKDTLEGIAELRNLDHVTLVMTMVQNSVENSSARRRTCGQLLFHLVREKFLSIDHLIKGLAEFLKVVEDLELDIPKIWDYNAQVMAPLVQDHKVLPINFLQACVQPLVAQNHQKETLLVTKILKLAGDMKGKEIIQAQWAASGLKLADFGISEGELQWLKGGPRNVVFQEVLNRLQRGDTNEEIVSWIDTNVKREERESNQFARELCRTLCRHSISEKNVVNTGKLKKRVPLMRKYIDTQERGTQALYGVQHLMCELEHPQGVARTLFELFFDEEVIPEESFFDWETREGHPEDMVGKGVVKFGLRQFYTWLRSSNDY